MQLSIIHILITQWNAHSSEMFRSLHVLTRWLIDCYVREMQSSMSFTGKGQYHTKVLINWKGEYFSEITGGSVKKKNQVEVLTM